MLVLKRKDGQWIEVIHRSGDVLRFKVKDIRGTGRNAQTDLCFDDDARNFMINRAELADPYPHPSTQRATDKPTGFDRVGLALRADGFTPPG